MTASSLEIVITRRRVRVDDTDARILYDGPWFVDTTGNWDSLGSRGRTFQKSLHGVRGAAASFSFTYEGTGADVRGPIDVGNSSGYMDPSWRCFLDGKEFAVPNTTTFPENHWSLCFFASTDVGAGKRTLSVQVSGSRRRFWLDHIDHLYSPPPTVAIYVLLSNRDPDIVYDGSWRSLYLDASYTTTPGAIMTMTFNGTGIDWYGMVPQELDHGSSASAYSLDGEPATPFTLKGLGDVNTSLYNQLFFSSPSRPFGLHNLTVTYLGSRTPLTLANLLIRDSTVPNSQDQPSNVTGSPTPSPSSSSGSDASTGTPFVTPFLVGQPITGRPSFEPPQGVELPARGARTGATPPMAIRADLADGDQSGGEDRKRASNVAPSTLPPPYSPVTSTCTTLPLYASMYRSFAFDQ